MKSKMHVLLVGGMFLLVTSASAQWFKPNTKSNAQTKPAVSSSNTTGNTTSHRNAIGLPVGSSTTTGNTTSHKDATGLPAGTSKSSVWGW